MKREAIIRAGGIDELMQASMDYDLQLRMLLEGEGYALDTPGIIFRVHDNQKTSRLLDARRKERFRIYRKLYAMIPTDSPYAALRGKAKAEAVRFGSDRLSETKQWLLFLLYKGYWLMLVVRNKLAR